MELHILLLFMIFAAVAALEARDLLSSIISLGAVGFALCLAFLILKAPDLAITQLVVEVLCLIILVKATVNKDMPLIIEGRWVFNTFSMLIFIFVFFFFSWHAVNELPRFGEPIMAAVRKYAEMSGGKKELEISSVLDNRVFDTIGEVSVLFASIMGIMAVLRGVGKRHTDRAENE